MKSTYHATRPTLDTNFVIPKRESVGTVLGNVIGGANRAYHQLPADIRWQLFGDKDALRQAVASGILNPDGTYVVDEQMEAWKRSRGVEEDSKDLLEPAVEMPSIEEPGIPDSRDNTYQFTGDNAPTMQNPNAQEAYWAFNNAKPAGYGTEMKVAMPLLEEEDEVYDEGFNPENPPFYIPVNTEAAYNASEQAKRSMR